eukprot:INCI12749.1.p1 GENE.INCI12749.1~~INCI12749.1.p1  ORF type:complete len:340 (+),score=81.54 INCI12749.1:121-1140(+)
MSGAEFTESMSLPADAPKDAFHYLKRFDSFDEFVEEFRKPGNVCVDAVPPQAHFEGEIVFDIVGIDCSIANALRRIVLNDVETMAVEQVMYYQNTGIMQDEKLAHRLGLIPILADAANFEARPEATGEPNATENDTLVFELDVECTEADVDRSDPSKLSKTVYSSELKWVPHGSQAERFKGHEPRPFHSDIIITRLGVGQKIKATCFAQKGSGRDHCKWQPATIFYRQLPVVRLLQDIKGEEADTWKKADVADVFDIEGTGKNKKLQVARPRNCTMAKNFLLLPGGREKIFLGHKEDHFLFTIEPIGQMSAREVFLRSLAELKAKAQRCIASLNGDSAL